MDEVWKVVFLSFLAGVAIPLGGVVARIERLRPQWLEEEFRHFVIAFGGGALLSAVALVLVPHGQKHLPLGWVAVTFVGGGLFFMGLDVLLQRSKTPASNLVATLSDYLPEAVALGAALGAGTGGGALLALLIALQNFPEGFNAYREMRAEGKLSARLILSTFCALTLLGPLAGLGGYFFLQERENVVGAITLFASGGILYIVLQDIAPQAKLEKHWLPGLGGVFGFFLGIAGQMLLH